MYIVVQLQGYGLQEISASCLWVLIPLLYPRSEYIFSVLKSILLQLSFLTIYLKALKQNTKLLIIICLFSSFLFLVLPNCCEQDNDSSAKQFSTQCAEFKYLLSIHFSSRQNLTRHCDLLRYCRCLILKKETYLMSQCFPKPNAMLKPY